VEQLEFTGNRSELISVVTGMEAHHVSVCLFVFLFDYPSFCLSAVRYMSFVSLILSSVILFPDFFPFRSFLSLLPVYLYGPCLSVFRSSFLPVCLSVCLSSFSSVCFRLSDCLSVCLFFCFSICPPVCWPACLRVRTYVSLSVCLSACLSTHLSASLSVCLTK
jgi:hypothetical protein